MPQTVPLTTLGSSYQQILSGSIFSSGYLFIENGNVDFEIGYGATVGQQKQTASSGIAPGQYTFTGTPENGIVSLFARAAGGVVSVPAQTVQGQFFEPSIPYFVPAAGGITTQLPTLLPAARVYNTTTTTSVPNNTNTNLSADGAETNATGLGVFTTGIGVGGATININAKNPGWYLFSMSIRYNASVSNAINFFTTSATDLFNDASGQSISPYAVAQGELSFSVMGRTTSTGIVLVTPTVYQNSGAPQTIIQFLMVAVQLAAP